jgi:hypothetical protein
VRIHDEGRTENVDEETGSKVSEEEEEEEKS